MEREVYAALARAEDKHWWFCARRSIAAHILRRLALPDDAMILEVGSGTGGVLTGATTLTITPGAKKVRPT